MTKKILQVDFIRELSVWQQEIEVEAHHRVFPKVLGIKTTVFFSYKKGISTAFRLIKEREKLPTHYIQLARKKGFAQKFYKKYYPDVKYLKRVSQGKKSILNSTTIRLVRSKLINIWPAYLFGYNLLRYKESGVFVAKDEIEKDNLKWAIKMHHNFEGVYDYIEIMVGNRMAEILNKQGYKKDDWKKMTAKDIYQAIGSNKVGLINKKELVIDEVGVHQISLRNYLKQKNLIYREKRIKASKNLKGIVACKGKVVGKVKVVSKNDSSKFSQFKKGDILVTMSTSPQFFPLMKKSSAIITDFGGQASHAAISARELKKPCIAGTKVATKVLKDGDKVEVDAELGIVRILKK